MKLLSDRIQEFIDWLSEMTEFGEWDETIKTQVHKQLITFMISDKWTPPEGHQTECTCEYCTYLRSGHRG